MSVWSPSRRLLSWLVVGWFLLTQPGLCYCWLVDSMAAAKLEFEPAIAHPASAHAPHHHIYAVSQHTTGYGPQVSGAPETQALDHLAPLPLLSFHSPASAGLDPLVIARLVLVPALRDFVDPPPLPPPKAIPHSLPSFSF